jgi:hypothetical protein
MIKNEDSLEKERDSISSIETVPDYCFMGGYEYVISEDEEDSEEAEYNGFVNLDEGKIQFEVSTLVRQNYPSFLDKFFDGVIQLLNEKPELYQEFYPLINQEFENRSFHYDRISWVKLHEAYNQAISEYKNSVESLFSKYGYSSYSSEEAETREKYETEFLEIFQTMKLYCEAYDREYKFNEPNPNRFPHIQSKDYPHGTPRAIPKEQLMLLPMFGGRVTLEKIEQVIARVKAWMPSWETIREKIEESEKNLKFFCVKEEIVQKYIENLREEFSLNSTLVEKFLIHIENTPFYLWDINENNPAHLKLRREPEEILTVEAFKEARHFVIGRNNSIFDTVDFNDIKFSLMPAVPWTPVTRKRVLFSLFSQSWHASNSAVLNEKNSKNKAVRFINDVSSNNKIDLAYSSSAKDDTDDESDTNDRNHTFTRGGSLK